LGFHLQGGQARTAAAEHPLSPIFVGPLTCRPPPHPATADNGRLELELEAAEQLLDLMQAERRALQAELELLRWQLDTGGLCAVAPAPPAAPQPLAPPLLLAGAAGPAGVAQAPGGWQAVAGGEGVLGGVPLASQPHVGNTNPLPPPKLARPASLQRISSLDQVGRVGR
jgi:hypothetical protein